MSQSFLGWRFEARRANAGSNGRDGSTGVWKKTIRRLSRLLVESVCGGRRGDRVMFRKPVSFIADGLRGRFDHRLSAALRHFLLGFAVHDGTAAETMVND
jgi:hypothetical protein